MINSIKVSNKSTAAMVAASSRHVRRETCRFHRTIRVQTLVAEKGYRLRGKTHPSKCAVKRSLDRAVVVIDGVRLLGTSLPLCRCNGTDKSERRNLLRGGRGCALPGRDQFAGACLRSRSRAVNRVKRFPVSGFSGADDSAVSFTFFMAPVGRGMRISCPSSRWS